MADASIRLSAKVFIRVPHGLDKHLQREQLRQSCLGLVEDAEFADDFVRVPYNESRGERYVYKNKQDLLVVRGNSVYKYDIINVTLLAILYGRRR